MQAHIQRMTHRLLTSLLAASACFALAAQPSGPNASQLAPAGQTETESGAGLPQQLTGESAAVPNGTAGMVIHIDPQTGAILKAPSPGTVPLQLTPQLQNALSTSHQ